MKRVVFFAMAVFGLAVVGVLGGCGDKGGENAAAGADVSPAANVERSLTVFVDTDEEGVVRAIFPDGSETKTQENYEAAVTHLVEANPDTEIEFEFGNELSGQLDVDLNTEPDIQIGDGQATPRVKIPIPGPYTPTIGLDFSPVGGCVGRQAWNVKLRLNYKSSQVFDLHVATWKEKGKACFGFYESVKKKVNICSCTGKLPTLKQVRETITNALVSIGITIAVAESMAAILASPVWVLVPAL